MIKVELFFKVTMFGSDWMVSAAEFKELRKEFLEIPEYEPLQRGQSIDAYEKEIKRLWAKLDERELEEEEEPLIEVPQIKEPVDQAEECPNYIEPPEIIDKVHEPILKVQEDEIKVQEDEIKVPESTRKKQASRDFSEFIAMAKLGRSREYIIKEMRKQWDIARPTAQTYYYKHITKAVAESQVIEQQESKMSGEEAWKINEQRAIENGKKELLKEIEAKSNKNKVKVIPEEIMGDPEPGKLFSKEFREKIQKNSSGSTWFGSTGVKE